MSKVIGNTVGTTFNPDKFAVNVPTKLSELENDLSSLTLGGTTIANKRILCDGWLQLGAEDITLRSQRALNLFSKVGTIIQGNVTMKGNVVINDVAYPENNTDAASKEYVDDVKPKKLSELENDRGYITEEDIPNVEVPTKMSELEQDLNKLNIGMVRISQGENGVATMGYMGSGILNIEGYQVNINPAYGVHITGGNYGGVWIHNLATPTNNLDAVNKKYVDDITGDISSALTNILAIQSQYMGVSE